MRLQYCTPHHIPTHPQSLSIPFSSQLEEILHGVSVASTSSPHYGSPPLLCVIISERVISDTPHTDMQCVTSQQQSHNYVCTNTHTTHVHIQASMPPSLSPLPSTLHLPLHLLPPPLHPYVLPSTRLSIHPSVR